MQLVVVSNPIAIVDEAKIINKLFESGLEIFHLRKPDHPLTAIRKLLDEIDPQYYQGISLHQFHEIASEYRIDRLHFPEKVRRETGDGKIKFLSESGYRLSTSIHRLADLDSLVGFGYAFFSPVFNSLSKLGYLGVVAADFKHTKTQKIDLIALGGVAVENITKCIGMNFDGVAVLGAIWNDPLNAIVSFNNMKQVIYNETYK
jgi:thiamine-phosphate pyrophosphorylase